MRKLWVVEINTGTRWRPIVSHVRDSKDLADGVLALYVKRYGRDRARVVPYVPQEGKR